MLPFGRMRPNKTTYWVFQLSGWETEWYEVVGDPSAKTSATRSKFAGGGIGACR